MLGSILTKPCKTGYIWMKMLCKYLSPTVEKIYLCVLRFKLFNSTPLSLFRVKPSSHSLPFLFLCCVVTHDSRQHASQKWVWLVPKTLQPAQQHLKGYIIIMMLLKNYPCCLLCGCENYCQPVTAQRQSMAWTLMWVLHITDLHIRLTWATAESICSLEDGMSRGYFKSKTNFSTYIKDTFNIECHLWASELYI